MQLEEMAALVDAAITEKLALLSGLISSSMSAANAAPKGGFVLEEAVNHIQTEWRKAYLDNYYNVSQVLLLIDDRLKAKVGSSIELPASLKAELIGLMTKAVWLRFAQAIYPKHWGKIEAYFVGRSPVQEKVVAQLWQVVETQTAKTKATKEKK